MTLATRLAALISAIGADIKALGIADIDAGSDAVPIRNIKHRRVTRAQLEALAENVSLVPGQLYTITDEAGRIAIGNNAATYTAFSKEGEGNDGWTNVVLAADFTTSNAAAQDSGIAFLPAANARVMFEARLMLRTATNTVGPRPGIAWPTGMTDGVAKIVFPSAATTDLVANGNVNAAMLIAVGGVPNANQSYLATMTGVMIAGGAPGASFRVQLASEAAGTKVTMKAGSFLRWKAF